MPLYKREGSPFWQYSFAVNGIRLRGSTGCTGKREAAIVEANKRHDAKNRKTDKDAWRLRDCLGSYWNERGKERKSAPSIFAKLDALSRILGPELPIMHLTNAMLLDYRATRRGEGLQAHGVNRDYACLLAALNHANQMHGQQIPALAWSRIKLPEPPNRIRFLSRDEYAFLLSVCDPELQKLVKMAVATGLRKANLLYLDWREVDLSSSRITVAVKGDHMHSVRLTSEARAALATVTDRRGKVFDTTNFRRRWQNAVKRAGLENFRFHDLRHTFASWARMSGADLADICEALGHSNISVTMRYAHIEPAQHKTAFDRISEMVWSHSESQSTGTGEK
jgi:integrase